MKAIIALGSNMGDRQGYLEAAQAAIEERVGHIAAHSSVMETKAYGYTDQDDFLNMAVEVETAMEPHAMLRELLAIEADLDRVRLIHWGPRTIDLDVIYCEDRIINDEISEYTTKINKAREIIGSLSKPIHRTICTEYYILGSTWEQVANGEGYSVSHVQKMHGWALHELYQRYSEK